MCYAKFHVLFLQIIFNFFYIHFRYFGLRICKTVYSNVILSAATVIVYLYEFWFSETFLGTRDVTSFILKLTNRTDPI